MKCKMCGKETPDRKRYKYSKGVKKNTEHKNTVKKTFCTPKCERAFKTKYKLDIHCSVSDYPSDIVVETRKKLMEKAVNGCKTSQNILRQQIGLRALWNKEKKIEVRF